MPHPIHRVARFEIAGPYTLSVTFADGTSQEIDFQPAALRNMNRSGSAGGASQQRTTRRCS